MLEIVKFRVVAELRRGISWSKHEQIAFFKDSKTRFHSLGLAGKYEEETYLSLLPSQGSGF